MVSLQRDFLAPVFMALGVIGLCASPVFAGEFTTQSGKTVPLTEIETMNCSQMEAKLRQIDATRYRENAPQPHNQADQPLFIYENNLSQVHYQRCVITPTQGTAGTKLLKKVNEQ